VKGKGGINIENRKITLRQIVNDIYKDEKIPSLNLKIIFIEIMKRLTK